MGRHLNDILQGWANWSLDKFNLLDEDTKKRGEVNLKICDACPMRSGNTCSTGKTGEAVKDFTYKQEKRKKGNLYPGCGCSLQQKVLSNSICPLGKF